jgi:hypothetical protein
MMPHESKGYVWFWDFALGENGGSLFLVNFPPKNELPPFPLALVVCR